MTQAEPPVPSTRPYLIRALYEWCSDNGYSPYIAVHVDASVQVPMEFVRNGEIVLNVSMEATKDLRLDNEYITFKARFGGVSREIVVPITHVIAIYARENGQGMAFPAPAPSQPPAAAEPAPPSSLRAVTPDDPTPPEPGGDGPGRPGGRPQLKRVK
ncbi:ClpXP protease specificity-enhancing factor [Hydrogenophaga sp. YM1]|jgi:stringent starvation protein B|uniref:ClpXP protease specificity-enhancing factor n=1 Tax=Hydrogenophaga TaxID=47420 RepID=UPI000869542B|nr:MULTISPECIES: ClpXP protease specificity-enhancing factor [unclassified Hydrogenophaga]MBN9372168.1 ClpXP protease specificity-enhancing factor [Hydrogenophaga sp.]ODT34318.1 MAG: ClpXP protease specificity-enhancing factor [Hydrogenophaga sp. SCN 70-13]OJV46563.1 MAG: ClpXP protease specificity-enhancing factor [Hydrogenophaga sp. 70-12]QRR35237.1 ClpXP protease specificity-enhancing factor [Hydrogenophaga sp. YM1]